VSIFLLRGWDHARTENAIVTPIITKVKEQTIVFYHTLDNSIYVARNGIELCDYFLTLCDLLLQTSVIENEARDFILNMREIAVRARQDAQSTSESFRSIRRGLNEISKQIPLEVEILRDNQSQAEFLKDKAVKQHDRVQTLTAKTSKRLPIFSAIIKSVGTRIGKKHAVQIEKQDQILNQNAGRIEELRSVSADVLKIVDHVDFLVNRWLEIDTGLDEVETMVGRLSSDNRVRIRIQRMMTSATSIRKLYESYQEEFGRLQNEYPANPYHRPHENLSHFLGNTARARQRTIKAEWDDYRKDVAEWKNRTAVESRMQISQIDGHDGVEELCYDDE